ncbi:hypothetical protein [Massilia sp. DD77]|uniref:hypothetical protein n=1 Tax=Massilia sp. DD77 TaxID=3109349 RepID=UPI0030001B04
MPNEVIVWDRTTGGAASRAWLQLSSDPKSGTAAVEALGFSLASSGNTARGHLLLDVPVPFPPVLATEDGGGFKLATWEQALGRVQEAARENERAVQHFVAAMRERQVRLSGAAVGGMTAGFLGASTVGGAAATTCVLTVDIGALLGGDDQSPVFTAELSAQLAAFACAPAGAAALLARLSFRLVLSKDSILHLLPAITAPRFSGLSIRWPRIVLPAFNGDIGFGAFPALGQMDLDGLFAFPLPSSALSVELHPAPVLAFNVAGGELTIVTTTPGAGTVLLNGNTPLLEFDTLELSVTPAGQSLSANFHTPARQPADLPDIAIPEALSGPFDIRLSRITATGQGIVRAAPPAIGVRIELAIGSIVIRARSDPTLVLALSATLTWTVENGVLTPAIDKLALIEPYPLELVAAASHIIADGARSLWAWVQTIPMPGAPPSPAVPSLAGMRQLLRRLGDMLVAAARWMAQKGLAAARVLADLAEGALAMLGRLMDALSAPDTSAFDGLAIEFRVDLSTLRLVQVVISPVRPSSVAAPDPITAFGLQLELPYKFAPSVVCDLEQGWIALLVTTDAAPPPAPAPAIRLSTDLWLDADGPTTPAGGTSNAGQHEPLISITATPAQAPRAVALVVLQDGKARFFQEVASGVTGADIVAGNGKVVVAAGTRLVGAVIALGERIDPQFDIAVTCDTDRILSLFKLPAAEPGNPNDAGSWSQYIQIKSVQVDGPPAGGVVKILVEAEIKVSGLGLGPSAQPLPAEFIIALDLATLSAELSGAGVDIAMADGTTFSLLGLNGRVRDIRTPPVPADFAPFRLDLNGGNPRIAMNDQSAALDLAWNQLSGGGAGLEFTVTSFAVARDGIDLEAATRDSPVTLAGVDMPFRFDQGKLSVKGGRIQAFGLTGHGNLPPALVGEAKATIVLNFAQRGARLALETCDAVLDKSGDPLRCENTRFTLNIEKLGLKVVEQSGYQFYFTLTGYAQFRPNGAEFADGLLKHLSKLKILLREVPLASDPSVLLQHIEFQVPVEPPDRTSFFDIFVFKLKGIGFHPASPAFDGAPAISLSGQVEFTDFGDNFNPRFDFHQLWIAPPKGGRGLPRIRFDGLGVSLSIGSAAEVSATAIAVDGKLPTMEGAAPPEQGVTAKGFLASGSLTLKGWASMSAAMGFLELEKPGEAEKRHAFFLYIQQNDIAIPIRTPVGELYIRELGYGLGYRYTLAGLAAADQAETPRELVALLDGISRYQGDLQKFHAWAPTYDNSALTLAMRALVSMTSLSPERSYNKEEETLPNPVLFDIVAALRTDLTFLMNLRAWIAFNYSDWRKARLAGGAPWQNKPTLTGYMYLSVRKQEFLARMVSHPDCEVGEHPKLYEPLVKAMKAVRWSSTLYVRPGLFHQELGWPYELGFAINKPEDKFFLSVEGGTVLRVEDAALLYGLAFRARGHIKFEASTGGDFGASVSAVASIALAAKFIAYLAADTSKALLYGAVSLDITIDFSVSVWIDTDFFSDSLDFTASFTIHVAAELAITSDGVSGRIEASVSVGAFGRSLSLGIGFDIGSRVELEDARRRSERFMSLGLGSDYPDPEQGVPLNRPPLPQPAPARNAETADNDVQEAAQHREQQGRTDAPREPAAVRACTGIDVGDTGFTAMLYPVDSDDGAPYFLVQFIPAGAPDPLGGDNFYAAPVPSAAGLPPEYELSLSQGAFAPGELLPAAAGQQVINGNAVACTTDWQVTVGRPGSGGAGRDVPPSLRLYFTSACFMAGDQARHLSNCKALRQVRCQLPEDAAERNKILARAARSRTDLGDMELRHQQVREARSVFIATVGQAAGRLAQALAVRGSVVVAPTLAELAQLGLELDPRALGLSFILSGERVAELLLPDAGAGPAPLPRVSIRTRLPQTAPVLGAPTPVVTFNPPHRMFRDSAPRLADPRARRQAGGVHLHWDLEPMWAPGAAPEDDPECHLKHYRIERRIMGSGFGRKTFTVKRSATLEFLSDPSGVHAREWGSSLVLVDDLADLPDAMRAQILPPALGADATARERQDAAPSDKVELLYLIQPVDGAGTAGQPVPWPISPPVPQPQQASFSRPVARFQYAALPALGRWPAPPAGQVPQAFLSLYLEEASQAPDGGDPAAAPVFANPEPGPIMLRLRTERTIAIGVFGADALTQARATPPLPGADRAEAPNETDLVLRPLANKQPPPSGGMLVQVQRVPQGIAGYRAPEPERDGRLEHYALDGAGWQRMRAALDLPPDDTHVRRTRAARLYLRPQPGQQSGKLPPEWVPVQMQLRIGAPPARKQGDSFNELPAAPVDLTVERFEHPVDLRFEALRGEIYPSSGRLFVLHPHSDATYTNCASLALPDAARRTAVRIAWEAQPDSLAAIGAPQIVAQDLQTLVGGFDLFMLDTAAVPAGGDALDHVAHIGRVQRLPSAERGQEPLETGDLATVEALYPSLTRRLEHGAEGSMAKTPWYSGAESFLRWPRALRRRSLVTAIDDVAIAALFANGMPTKLEITSDPVLTIGIDGATGSGAISQAHAGGLAATLPGVAAFTPDLVRRLLLDLVDASPSRTPPAPPPDLRLRATSQSGAWFTGETSIATAKRPDMHPVVADVLDLLRYSQLGNHAAKLYRGREVVVEAAPPVTATTLAGFFDDSNAERDPTGWGVLRSLGLAAAFRLYDLDAGTYLAPDALHDALATVLKVVLPRYAADEASIGAPFADIMTTSEGLARLVSFSGAAPNEQLSGTRVKADSLAFAQFELRPVAQLLACAPPASPAVRYATLVWTAQDPFGPPRPFPADGIALEKTHFAPGVLAEVELAAVTDGSSKRRSLLLEGWTGDVFPVDGEDILDAGIVLRQSSIVRENGDAILGWVRLVNFFGNVPLEDPALFASPLPGRLQLQLSSAPGADSAGAPDRGAEVQSPWGRFMPLPERWQAVLQFPEDLPTRGTAAADRGDTLEAVMEALKPYAGRPGAELLDKKPLPANPNDPAQQKRARAEHRVLAGKLARWSQRFMDHGPARRVAGPADPTATGVAFAMLTRPTPWRAAPDSEGRLSVLVFEKDRYGKTRKYAVRPFARYENLAIATLAAAAAEPGLSEALARARHAAWADAARPNLLSPGVFGTAAAGVLATHFADVVMERSEPLAPPVFLAARSRREGIGAQDRYLEFVVARHPEEILAEANIGTDAAIAMRHVGVGFWREFLAPTWVRRLERSTNALINELAPFGPARVNGFPRLGKPAGLLVDDSTNVPLHLGELQETLPDLWTGAYVLRMLNMPYGFRLLATAHLAAGVAVSAPNAVSVEGPACRLSLPWPQADAPAPAPAPHWQERAIAGFPSYTVRRQAGEAQLLVRWPLVRLIDGMQPDTRRLWFEGAAAPDIFRIPDPAVAYRLCVATADGMLSVPEVMLSPVPEPDPDATGLAAVSLYLVETLGTRYTVDPTLEIVQAGDTHFELTARLSVAGQSSAPPPPVFSPRLAGPPDPARYRLASTDAALWQAWIGIVPWPGAAGTLASATIGLILSPPAVADPPQLPPPLPQLPTPQAWLDFEAGLRDFIARLRTYADAGLPATLQAIATTVADALAPFAVHQVADWPEPAAGGLAQPARLIVPWVLGLPLDGPGVALEPAQQWRWPAGDMGIMDAAARGAAAQLFAAFANNAGGPPATIALGDTADAVLEAMRQFVIDERRHRDELPFAGIEAVSEPLPPASDLAQWPASDAHDALAVLSMPAGPRAAADVDSAFDALETVVGAAPTLAALARMRRDPSAAIELPMWWSARAAVAPVLDILAQVGGGMQPAVQGLAMRVRAPFEAAEIAALGAVHADLPALAGDISRRMLFGAKRKLLIQALQGQEKPLEYEVRSMP